MRHARLLLWLGLLAAGFTAELGFGRSPFFPVLNEFSAVGDAEDWVEVYNPGPEPFPEMVVTLRDGIDVADANEVSACLPSLGPGEHVVIACPNLLNSNGEEIGLFDEHGMLLDAVSFGRQAIDFSFGRITSGAEDWAFQIPTPGFENVPNPPPEHTTPRWRHALRPLLAIADVEHQPAVLGLGGLLSVKCVVVAEEAAPQVQIEWNACAAGAPCGLHDGEYQVTLAHDDGLHGDGAAGDGLFGAVLTAPLEPSILVYRVRARIPGGGGVDPGATMETFSYTWRVGAGITAPPVVVNEVCSLNTAVGRYPLDTDPPYADWIELYNSGDEPVDLRGFALSDSHMNLWQFPLPQLTVAAGEKVLVWASRSVERVEPVEVDFSISQNGEEIALFYDFGYGSVAVDVLEVPALDANTSFGRVPDGTDTLEVLEEPTPEGGNVLPPLRIGLLGYDPVLPGRDDSVTVRAWVAPDVLVTGARLVCGTLSLEVPFAPEAPGQFTYSGVIPADVVAAHIGLNQLPFHVEVDDSSGTTHRAPEVGFGHVAMRFADPSALQLNEVFAGDALCPTAVAFEPEPNWWESIMWSRQPHGPGMSYAFVELHNTGTVSTDLGHLYLSTDPLSWNEQGFRARDWSESSLGPGQYAVVPFLGGDEVDALDPSGGAVFLVDGKRRVVMDAVVYSKPEPGGSFGRTPDGTGVWSELRQPTPRMPNRAAFFVRGDADGNSSLELTDAVVLLAVLFQGRTTDCTDALDADDSSLPEITDAVYLLLHLFSSGTAPPPPFPEHGIDPTPDSLDCER